MFSHLRQVLTIFLLTVGVTAIAGGCVSNPTPHPGHFDARGGGETKVSFEPTETPGFNDGDHANGGGDIEPTDPTAGVGDAGWGDALDGVDDDNDTWSDPDAEDGYERDGEVGPIPGAGAAMDDNDSLFS